MSDLSIQGSHTYYIEKNLFMENGQKNKVENILKKSWKSHGISLLLITNHAREVQIIPYLSRPTERFGFWRLSVYVLDFKS